MAGNSKDSKILEYKDVIRTHAELFKNVPSCDEIISLPEEERNCPTCGTQLECIGKEFVRHEFRFTPTE